MIWGLWPRWVLHIIYLFLHFFFLSEKGIVKKLLKKNGAKHNLPDYQRFHHTSWQSQFPSHNLLARLHRRLLSRLLMVRIVRITSLAFRLEHAQFVLSFLQFFLSSLTLLFSACFFFFFFLMERLRCDLGSQKTTRGEKWETQEWSKESIGAEKKKK